jgi:hypothetical protein
MKIVTTVELSKTEKKAAKANLAKVRKIFGPKGKNWLKGDENDGNGHYCLIGALKKADGAGEHIAAGAVIAAIRGYSLAELINEVGDSNYGVNEVTEDDILLNAYDAIPDFNDTGSTSFSKIKKILTAAEKLVA